MYLLAIVHKFLYFEGNYYFIFFLQQKANFPPYSLEITDTL